MGITNKMLKFLKKISIFFILFLSIFNVHSQKLNQFLGKAFSSKDSSDYYFKLANNEIKSDKDKAQFFFCKGARNGDYNVLDSAIFYNKIAIDLNLKLNDNNTLLYLFNNNSKNYRKLGEYDKALKSSFNGLKIAEKIKNDYWIFQYTVALSNLYHDFENFEKGVFYGKKAFDLASSKKPLDVASALNVIAINYDDWQKPELALKYHKKVFEYVKGKDTLLLFSTYNNIGNTLLKQKKYKEAEAWILKAKKVNEINESKNTYDVNYYDKSTYSINLAVIAYKLNHFEKAENLFKIAKQNCIKSNNAEKIRDYYYQEYLFNKANKNLEEAIKSQDSYLKIRDSVFNLNRDKVITEIETKYQIANKEKIILQNKIEAKNKNTAILILILTSIFIGLIGYLIYRQQRLKNKQQNQEFLLKSAIKEIETQNELQEQRLSISRDLHDNIGAQLTFIISSVDNLKFGNQKIDDKINNQLSKISNFTKATIIELRDTIWAMNGNEFTFEDLRSRIFNFIEKAQSVKEDIQFNFTIDASLKEDKITSIEGINIYRTIQEAINNAMKYANATTINVDVKSEENYYVISISDDGNGFDLQNTSQGNGLHNMKKRIEEINGKFDISSTENQGTTIEILIPNTKL